MGVLLKIAQSNIKQDKTKVSDRETKTTSEKINENKLEEYILNKFTDIN